MLLRGDICETPWETETRGEIRQKYETGLRTERAQICAICGTQYKTIITRRVIEAYETTKPNDSPSPVSKRRR